MELPLARRVGAAAIAQQDETRGSLEGGGFDDVMRPEAVKRDLIGRHGVAAVPLRTVEITRQPGDLRAPLTVGAPAQEVVCFQQCPFAVTGAGERLDDRDVCLGAQDPVGVGGAVTAPCGDGIRRLADLPIQNLADLVGGILGRRAGPLRQLPIELQRARRISGDQRRTGGR
jgi:hypothetical protein